MFRLRRTLRLLDKSCPKHLSSNALNLTKRNFNSSCDTDPMQNSNFPTSFDSFTEATVTSIPDSMNPTYQIMNLIESIHSVGGLPYWESIVVLTVGVRLILLPLGIKAIQNGARMGVLRPDMEKVNKAFADDPRNAEPAVRGYYQKEMRALFQKHKVNPIISMMLPLAQLPIFISMFWAMKEFGQYVPAFATGGALWFTDLSVGDPYYILCVTNSLSFLTMIEIGADGIQTSHKDTFKFAMRALAVVMVPVTASMPSVCHFFIRKFILNWC